MKRIDWFILAFVVFAFWVFDVILIALIENTRNSDFPVVLCLGICIGQINLIGAWGALAPGKVIVRLPWAVFLGVLMWKAIDIGQHIEGGFTASDRLHLGVSIGFGVIVAQVPLWFARWRFGWRLLPPRFPIESVAETDAQFNLKHLFLGMFFTSLALGLVRITLPELKTRDFGMASEIFIILPVVAICNALVTAPCIWMAYCQVQRLFAWAAAWMFYAIIVSAGELFVLTIFLGPPGGNENTLLVLTFLNLTQCATVFATMLLLRWLGFKLIRTNQLAAKQPSLSAETSQMADGSNGNSSSATTSRM